MSFIIGDTVEPVTTITFSGTDFELTGVSGVVVDLQVNGAATDGTPTYLYKVTLEEALVVGSGADIQSENTFWFTESELGGAGAVDDVDFVGVSNLLNSGINTVSQSQGAIQQSLSQTSTTSPYYTDIAKLLELNTDSQTTLNSQDISDQSKGSLAVASGVSDINAFSSEVYKELSDNLFGFYSVVSTLEQELQAEEQQAAAQEALAMADDEQNFNIFYSSYVDNEQSVNLLSPEDTSSEVNTTEISQLIEDTDISADLLNAPSIDLETD